RSHPQGRQAGRSSGSGANQVRTGDQSQDRESPRPHCRTLAARSSRRGDRMRRREFMALLGGAALARPLTARAQVSPRRPLIAVVIAASQAASERWRSGLPQGLQELGYVEGRDYEIENRYADGDLTRQPMLVDELIQRRPNVIVAGNANAAVAAERATADTPIVVAAGTDPVLGYSVSLARPGGHITGIILNWDSLVGKLLELGLELMPGAKRFGMLVNVNNISSNIVRRGGETGPQTIGGKLTPPRVPA